MQPKHIQGLEFRASLGQGHALCPVFPPWGVLRLVHSTSLFSTHQAKRHMGQVTRVTSCSWPSPGPDPMAPTAQYLKHTAYGQLALRQRGPGVGILQGNRHQGPQGLLASLLAPTALLQEARRAGRGRRLSRKKREAPGKTAGLVGGACRS